MENILWDTEEYSGRKRVYVLVIYDIVENRKRTRLAKYLQGYGFRVQKSAFEAMISEQLFQKLKKEIPAMIDPEEDSVRIYRIVGKGEVTLLGNSDRFNWEDTIII